MVSTRGELRTMEEEGRGNLQQVTRVETECLHYFVTIRQNCLVRRIFRPPYACFALIARCSHTLAVRTLGD